MGRFIVLLAWGFFTLTFVLSESSWALKCGEIYHPRLNRTVKRSYEPVKTENVREAERDVAETAARVASKNPGLWRRIQAQARAFKSTVRRLRVLMDVELAPERLDEYLWQFYGFSQGWGAKKAGDGKHPNYAMRVWQKVPVRSLESDQVVGMSIVDFVGIARFAMEIEAPILQYTEQSGTGFRFLLPTLGRFMGKTEEQMSHVRREDPGKERPKNWCESPWCAEEGRHEGWLKNIIARFTGRTVDTANVSDFLETVPDEAGALFHLNSRMSTEWGASSSYFLLASHARGPLYDYVRNILRDEVKHLTIISAAYQYLKGPQYLARTYGMLKKTIREVFEQGSGRSGGGGLFLNPFNLIEVALIHLMVERRIRRYLRTLPLDSLRMIFDSPSALPEMASVPLERAERASFERLEQEHRAKKDNLTRWSKGARKRALDARAFEIASRSEIDEIIREQLVEFQGAEVIGTPGSRNMFMRIDALQVSPEMRQALRDRLRDFQIRNARSRVEVPVEEILRAG